MAETVLTRLSNTSYQSYNTPNQVQAKVDAVVEALEEQLLDPYNLVAMGVGAVAYGYSRMTFLKNSQRLLKEASLFENKADCLIGAGLELNGLDFSRPALEAARHKGLLFLSSDILYRSAREASQMARLLRWSSAPIALGNASLTFELTRRSLLSASGKGNQNSNLWRWGGRGGVSEGLASTALAFALPMVAGEFGGRLGLRLLAGKPRPILMMGTGVAGLLSFLGTRRVMSSLNDRLGL